MVPLYQIAVHIVLAAVLLLGAIYWPLISRRKVPRWAEAGMLIAGVVLLGGAVFAVVMGHWPSRG